MPSWPPFTISSVTYDLSHLMPFECTYVQPATADKPERSYRVWIEFGHHCFTRGIVDSDPDDLIYPEPWKDQRTFDVDRWHLSKVLPNLISNLMNREVRHTDHGNFLTISDMALDGTAVEYEVYFKVSKTGKKMYLFVSSAFPRDPARLGARPARRTMKLSAILYNVQVGKPVKPPQGTGRRH